MVSPGWIWWIVCSLRILWLQFCPFVGPNISFFSSQHKVHAMARCPDFLLTLDESQWERGWWERVSYIQIITVLTNNDLYSSELTMNPLGWHMRNDSPLTKNKNTVIDLNIWNSTAVLWVNYRHLVVRLIKHQPCNSSTLQENGNRPSIIKLSPVWGYI